MKAKSKAGFSLPWLTIILIIVIAAALIWGWQVFLYVGGLVIIITLPIWLVDKIRHLRGCPDCRQAREFFQTQHKDWEIWIDHRSHRATEAKCSVVAVFYQGPGQYSRPPSYKLFPVQHGSGIVTELSKEEGEFYRISNYK